MRLDVTPLGGAGRTIAHVAGAIVEDLEGGVGDPGGGLLSPTVGGSSGEGLVSYYGDSAEAPGRWIGQGAAAHRLEGTVEPGALARVLEGRHPHTGARLLTARGSSQRTHLATGTAARFDECICRASTAPDVLTVVGASLGRNGRVNITSGMARQARDAYGSATVGRDQVTISYSVLTTAGGKLPAEAQSSADEPRSRRTHVRTRS